MQMNIDQAGHNQLALCVKRFRRSLRTDIRANGRDAAGANGDIGNAIQLLRSVYHAAVANHEVVCTGADRKGQGKSGRSAEKGSARHGRAGLRSLP